MCKCLREFKEKSGLSSYATAEEVRTSWENLAAAIVIQAADDYRDALVTIEHYRWGDPVEELEYANTVKTSCERFFRSDYAKRTIGDYWALTQSEML